MRFPHNALHNVFQLLISMGASIAQWAVKPRNEQRYLLSLIEQTIHTAPRNHFVALAAETGSTLRISLREELLPGEMEAEEMEMLRGTVEYVVRQRYPTIRRVELARFMATSQTDGARTVQFELLPPSAIKTTTHLCLSSTDMPSEIWSGGK